MRETTFNLLAQAGAIAGTNADFFGMRGTHSLAFGPVIANGELMSITASYNEGGNEFASFFLDNSNIPMPRYIRPHISFRLNGMELMRVISVNKAHNINRPVIINRNGMPHTSQLNARFPNIRKVIVDNERVAGVGASPMTVPENGFIVVMNEDYFYRHRPYTWIGLHAQYEVSLGSGMSLSQIQTAVGGGGLILQHGHTVRDTGTAVSGRHPRTALGITSDWQHLVLMVVDGRGHSIGATHEEMAAQLRRRGVSEAMHLDGGGSSTMAAQAGGRGTPLRVVNRVSDGSQRAVINAIGIFDHSLPGAIHRLVLMPYNRFIPRGSSINFHVYGLDLYRHRIGVNPAGVIFSAYTIDSDGQRWPATGIWNGSVYTPDRPGRLYIRARYGELTVSKTYIVQDIVALRFASGFVVTPRHLAVPLEISGITTDGTSSVMTPHGGEVHFSVTPPGLGVVLDNVFMPNEPGRGHITAAMGSVFVHMPVMVTSPYEETDPNYVAAFIEQVPPTPAFTDPIRTEMTPAVQGHTFDFSVSVPAGPISYSSRQEGAAVVLRISAANGGIFATDRNQWGRFPRDINMVFPDFVIIQMDINPLRMPNREEAELFHQALRAQQELGRTVFVLSNVEQSQTLTIRDGIRYIDLGNAGGGGTVWFRVIDRQIWYDF